jgi:aminomethyltransferase
MLKKTPIYNLHVEMGAKMVPYAGYQMPVQYGNGTLLEHQHCRSHAGFFDISHMGLFMIRGEMAIQELGRLIPTDISGLKLGEQKYTILTNDKGGIIDDIIITRMESGLMLVVNAACKEKDFNYLSDNLSGECFFNELTEHALFALQGPDSQSIMDKLSPKAAKLSFMTACGTEVNGIKCNISRSGYTGEDGFEILVDSANAEQLARLLLAEDEVEPIGLAARDTLRLEAGLSLYGHEINESITPIEAGLQWLLAKNHSQYPGANIILAQMRDEPEKVKVGLFTDSKVPVREGSVIYSNEGVAAGYVTSGSFSPSLQRPIAMALIDPYVLDLGYPLHAVVREHRIVVTLTSLPFIPHRYQR